MAQTVSIIHLILLIHFLQFCFPYQEYKQKIPNGNKVPHPCGYNIAWGGVGHENPNGGGDRNPFGRDFDANGKVS